MFEQCPACSHLLQHTHIGEVEADLCTQGCGGLWLSAHNIETLAHKPKVVEELMAKIEFVEPLSQYQTRLCPKCRQALNTSMVHGEIDVEIDTCPRCLGIWLDKGEVTALTRLHRRAKLKRHRPYDYHSYDGDDAVTLALDSIVNISIASDIVELGADSVALAVNQAPSMVDIAAGLPEATVDVVSVTASGIADGVGASAEAVGDIVGGAADIIGGFADLLGGLFDW